MFISTCKICRDIIFKPEFAGHIFSKFSFSKCKHSTRICKNMIGSILQLLLCCLLLKFFFSNLSILSPSHDSFASTVELFKPSFFHLNSVLLLRLHSNFIYEIY